MSFAASPACSTRATLDNGESRALPSTNTETDDDPRPRVGARVRVLVVRRLLREALHELGGALFHFLRGQILLVRGDRPLIAGWIDQRAGAIAPELIRDLAHRTLQRFRARGNGPVEDGITVLDVQPERRRRSSIGL